EGASLFDSVKTGVDRSVLIERARRANSPPAGFHLHPKLQKWAVDRVKMMEADPQTPSIDWGLGECLAFGSLLLEKTHVRLSGQDVRLGTFSHRHLMWVDQETGAAYFPLAHLQEGQGRLDIINSPLSEYA